MTENELKQKKKDLINILNQKIENLKKLEEFGKNSKYIKELSDIALIQLQLERYKESELNYLICLKHFKKQKDRLGQAAVYGVFGILYFKEGDFQRSIEFYEKALEIYKELKQIQELITCLKGIGNDYIKLNQLEKAGEIFLECSAICSDNDDIYNLLDCMGNLTFIYEKLENFDVLNELYQKSLKCFKQINDNKGIIVSSFNLGIVKKKNKKFNEALNHFKEGTNIAIESNYAELIVKGLSYIGEIYFLKGESKKAKNEFIKALHLAEELKAKNAILQLRIVLKSIGLNDRDIDENLQNYQKTLNSAKS